MQPVGQRTQHMIVTLTYYHCLASFDIMTDTLIKIIIASHANEIIVASVTIDHCLYRYSLTLGGSLVART